MHVQKMIIWDLIILPVFVTAHTMDEVLKDPKDLALSKALSWLLRHGAVTEGLDISKDGYIQLNDIVKHRLFARRYSRDDIRRIVSIDNYRFNLRKNPLTGNLEIRANHGHTIDLQKGSSNLLDNHPYKSGKIQNEYKQQQYNRVVDPFAAHSEDSDDRSVSESYITYTELARILSWMLIHGTKRAGLTKSSDGFVPVDTLLEHAYLKGKCNIEDIVTIADNEPELYELKKNPDTQLLEIRINVDYKVKILNKAPLTKIPHSVYLPLPYVIRGVNESEWEDVINIRGIRGKSEDGYIYFSPYEPADCYATKGVTRHDDIYIYVGIDAAIEDGIEFYKTVADEIITKGNDDGIVPRDYYVKVVDRKSVLPYGRSIFVRNSILQWHRSSTACVDIYLMTGTYYSIMATTPETVYCEVCNISVSAKIADSHFTGKKHITRQNQLDRMLNSVFVSGVQHVPRDVMFYLFRKFGRVEEISDYEGKTFCFVKFLEKGSPKKALKARLFYKGHRLFIRSVRPQYNDQNAGSRIAHQEKEDLDVEIGTISVQSDGEKSAFDLQVDELVSRIQLGEDEYRKHLEICNDLEETFRFLGARAIIFGSCGNSLAMKNSDIDIYLDCTRGQPEETFVSKDCKVMYKSKLYSHIIRIGKARVPIVRFIHKKTGIRCDVTVKNKLGVMNSKLIKLLISLDQRIRPFIMLLKFWAKEYSITANSQLSSYALIVMAIFYLQQLKPPLLPPISELITSDEIQGGWRCGFIDNPWAISLEQNSISLKKIVKGFFKFYARFDYNKHVICPLLGQPVLIDDFETPERLPDAMKEYKYYIRDNPDYPFKINFPLRIQDPFELNYNLGRGFTDKLLKVLRDTCFQSYMIFKENENENELLGNLLVVSKKPRCVKEGEKSFCIPWSIQGSDEKYIRRQPPAATPEAVNEWYILVKKAVLIVFKDILKIYVEEADSNISNKIKKSSNQNDVHAFEKSVFHCTGSTIVFRNRKKLRKRLRSCRLDEFEKEVRVSNSRQCFHVDDSKSLSFVASVSLHIPSANEIPYVLIILQNSNMDKGDLFASLLSSLQSTFETFVEHAITHIRLKRKTLTFIELTDLLNCDCDGCKIVGNNPTVQPENKNCSDTNTNDIQSSEKTNVDAKISDNDIIESTESANAKITNKIIDCSIDTANPFLAAIERQVSTDRTETNLCSTNNNESDNGSKTLWNRKNNESNNDNITDFGSKLDNSKSDASSKTDDGKSDNGSKIVNDNKSKKSGNGRIKSNVVENVEFVNKMYSLVDTLAMQKEKNNISHSVYEEKEISTTSTNRQIYELKNIKNTVSSSANIPVSYHTYNKNNKSLTGNMKHNFTWNKTSSNQAKIKRTPGFVSMKAERIFSKINIEVKPPTKNTVTVEDMKLYVKNRFHCENVDEHFLLALAKISNDIINNSSKS